MVYVLAEDGKPLMPSKRYHHIKRLLLDGKAVVVCRNPFTVRLLYATPGKTQPVTLGIDPGRTNIGFAAVTEDGKPLMEGELSTRNREVPKLVAERKQFRMAHRRDKRRRKRIRRAKAAGTVTLEPCGVIKRTLPGCEEPIYCKGIRNKEARFNNRVRPDGWLTPTATHLLQTHINLIKRICKFLPVTRVVLEVNRFAFMAMDNPNVQKWQYAKGPLYQKGSVRDAVYEMQDGECLLCGRPIEHYHHIVPRSKRGSETLPNIVGLCMECHAKVHTDLAVRAKLEKRKAGLNKKYGALSVLNQIIPSLVNELNKLFPLTVTDGRSTKQFREIHSLEKTHFNDAYCIACSVLNAPIVQDYKEKALSVRQFRRHDRQACIQARLTRKYVLNGQVVAENRHKATEQLNDSLEEYVEKGGQTDSLSVKLHLAVYKHMDRVFPGALMCAGGEWKVMTSQQGYYNGHPNYYFFTDGTRITPKHCRLVRRNRGLVFV